MNILINIKKLVTDNSSSDESKDALKKWKKIKDLTSSINNTQMIMMKDIWKSNSIQMIIYLQGYC